MRTECLDKKVSFRQFLEKMNEYILREFKNPNDVLSVLRDEEDPRVSFETNNLPDDLTDVEKQSDVKVVIQQQRIKNYVDREMEMENNMFKIYGLMKGQCSHSLRAVLKKETKFKEKDTAQDVLWLLKKLRGLTSGLDNKSNKRCNLFEALMAFVTMRQGEQ